MTAPEPSVDPYRPSEPDRASAEPAATPSPSVGIPAEVLAGSMAQITAWVERQPDVAGAAHAALAALNSNLFYWFITVFSDCRHVNKLRFRQ